MFFKRLEIIGFKSFGDKTVFEFEPGITTIVGPNGCGKSNVVDAVRWVLGEQSAKALRGSRMEDVIFNGTDERSPINIAEVSFTLEDPEKTLPIGFHEITVTRRVFRDGQGEYRINQAPCRLRDIHELFMGTGIGTDAYSILEQGKMDQVINAKPQERREIFEEAAGITKFKSKKTEALRKLEYTEENLIRVNDIIKEVKRQIHSVQRYAVKASRYRKLFDEVKMLEVAFHGHRYGQIAQILSKVQTDLADVYKTQKEKLAHSEAAQAQLNANREHLQEISNAFEALREEVSTLDSDIHRREGQARADQQKLLDLKQSVGRWQSEIEEHRKRIEKLQQELAQSQQELGACESSLKTVRADVSQRDENIRGLQEKIRSLTQRQKQSQEQSLEEELQASRWKNEVAGLAASGKTTLVKRERLGVEQQNLRAQGEQLQVLFTGAHGAIASQGEQTRVLRQQITEISNVCVQIQKNIEGAQEQGERLREELAKKRTQASLMDQMESGGLGFVKSVSMLLAKQKQEPSRWSGLIGKLGDGVEATPGYEKAVSAGLARWADDLAVDGHAWIEKIREAIQRESTDVAHSVTLLCKDMMRAQAVLKEAGLQDARILGALKKFLKCNAQVQPFVDALVAQTYVVGSWADALALANEYRDSHPLASFVTLQGECVQENGRVALDFSAGGAQRPDALVDEGQGMGLQIERLREVLHDTIVEKGGMVVALEEQKRKISLLETALRKEEIQQATAQNEQDKLATQRDQLANNLSVVMRELEELGSEEERFTQEQRRYERLLAEYEKNQHARKIELEQLGKELEESSSRRETLLEEVTHRKIQLASLEEKWENGSVQSRNLGDRLTELRSLYASKETDAKEAVDKITELETTLAGWQQQQDVLISRKSQRQEDLKNAGQARQASLAQSNDLEGALAAARKILGELTDRQRTLEVERAQLQAQKDNLRENLLKEFQVDLEAPTPLESASATEPFSLESYGGSWESAQARIAELRKTLEGIGPVNMAALQEHDELQARYDFLTKQHEDLVNAKETLLKVLARINTTTRKLFADTFALIRGNFQTIFVQLFGGGKADLLLTDESDLLETGIEIVAKPPGKQLRVVSLMSGGEKALTAIALLFAIFQVKPSPFCILDEIDAPLDESNISRFVSMLRDYSKKTQFILITHNKRTISSADILYGVTMQESGLSKVVSVRLAEGAAREAAEVPVSERLQNRGGATPLFSRPALESYSRGGGPATGTQSTAEPSADRSEG